MSTTPTTTSSSPSMMIPPQLMMWAGIYAVMFTIAGGMIAFMYNRN